MRASLGWALGLLLAAAPGAAAGASAGADPGFTGAPAGGGLPAEGDCTTCHASAARNPDAAGEIELLGLPERYRPGERYALTLRLAHPDASRMRWGFAAHDRRCRHVPARRRAGGDGRAAARSASTAAPEAASTWSRPARARGIGETGEQLWRFAWVAPESGAGEVLFFGSGNAANADGSNQGDWIFSPSPAPLARVGAEGP